MAKSRDEEPYVKEGWLGPGKKDSVIQILTPQEDGLHVDLRDENEYELWYFDAQLDTGHTLIVFFYAANPNPLMFGRPGIEVILIRPDSSKENLFFPYPKSAFSTSEGTVDIRISGNYFKVKEWRNGLPIYELCVNEGNFNCRLFYESEVEAWKPGRGVTRYGSLEYFAWIIPVTRASITGTFSDKGKTLNAKGYGYHDHNWLNLSFPKIIDYWFWGRFYFSNQTFCIAVIQCSEAAEKHIIKVLMKANGKDVILSTGEFNFHINKFNISRHLNIQYPSRINIVVPNDIDLQINIRKVLESEDMLCKVRQPARFFANLIIKERPVYFRIDAECILKNNVSGDISLEHGSGLHELVIFRPSY